MNEDDKRDLAFISFIFTAGIMFYCLYNQLSTEKQVTRGEDILLQDSLYKCKMIKTLKEKTPHRITSEGSPSYQLNIISVNNRKIIT